MEKFTLDKSEEYIQLNDLMKVLNWVGSGGEAKQLILDQQVSVNGNLETRIRRKLRVGDQIEWRTMSAEICQ